jgi:hypothetical protein
VQLDLRHVGDEDEPGGLGGADNRDVIRAILAYGVSGLTRPVV